MERILFLVIYLGNQLIQFKNPQDALPNLFRYYLYKRKVGLAVCLTGGQGQKTGAGKSYTAMRLAQLTDPKFGIDDVCYTPREFLERLDDIEAGNKIGRCIVLDEGEIAVSSRKWQQKTNETIGETLQTFRYLRCMAIIVTPLFSLIDKNVRKLISYWGTTSLYNKGNDIFCKLKLYNLTTDIFGEKIYPRRLFFWDKVNKKIVRGNAYDVGLITPELIEAYEIKSREFKQAHRRKLLKETIMLDKQGGYEDLGKGHLPAIAEELLQHPLIKQTLEEKGRVAIANVLMVKRNLPVQTGYIVCKLINEMAGTAPREVAKIE